MLCKFLALGARERVVLRTEGYPGRASDLGVIVTSLLRRWKIGVFFRSAQVVEW